MVCLFVDDADEMESLEEHQRFLDHIDDLQAFDRIKLCVAIRDETPWSPVFVD